MTIKLSLVIISGDMTRLLGRNPKEGPSMHDEELRRWLEQYIAKHPHHSTAVLSRSQSIGFAKRALDAYLEGKYFLPKEDGGEGADPQRSGIEEAIRGYRQQIEGVERHGYVGMFVETGTWKYLQHACD